MYRDEFNKISDSFKTYLVEGAKFTENLELPIIEDYMVAKEKPPK